MVRLFYSSPIFGRKMLRKSPKCQGLAQCNLVRAITSIALGLTIYYTIFQLQFISTLPVFRQKKLLKKKLATVNAHWTNYWIWNEGPGLPGRTCTPTTGYFHDKTEIFKETFLVDYYLFPHTWAKSLTKFNTKCVILNVFWTYCKL